MKKVLFLSSDNSCRSPIAEAIVNNHYRGRVQAKSAGVSPVPIHCLTVQVLKEIEIDISQYNSNTPEDFKNESFDYIITLCSQVQENCPVFWTMGESAHNHWDIPNPFTQHFNDAKLLQEIRNIRDDLEDRLMNFFDKELAADNKYSMPSISSDSAVQLKAAGKVVIQ